jgi:carboxypeptidase Taq
MSMHESQSLFWERHIGKSKNFWEYQLQNLKSTFKLSEELKVEDFYKGINVIKNSLIRVERFF